MVSTSFVSPPPSDIPLLFDKRHALFKKIHSRLFQRREFPVKDGYAIVKGMGLVKEVLLRSGYTVSGSKLVSRRPDIWPDIPLVGRSFGIHDVHPPYSISQEKSALVARGQPDIPLVRGQIAELDLNRIAPEPLNVLYQILVEPTLIKKRAAAAKASRQRQMNRWTEGAKQTELTLAAIRQQRADLLASAPQLTGGPSSSTLPRSPSTDVTDADDHESIYGPLTPPSRRSRSRSRSRSPRSPRSPRSRSRSSRSSDGWSDWRRRRRR